MNNTIEKNETADMKERILKSAIEEFGRRDYEAASTNVIVQNAGVSKGLLFHYFGSKKNLYLECIVHVLDMVAKYIFAGLDVTETDMFLLLKRAIELKLRFYQENPKFMGLANRMWYSESRTELEARLPKYVGDYKEYDAHPVFQHADRSRLKDGMDFSMVVEYTSLLLEACWLRFCAKYHENYEEIAEHIDEYLAEVDKALHLIRYGVYKG